MQQFVNEKVLPPVMKFVNTRGVTAIKNGMLFSLPFIVVGAFFLLLANIPYDPAKEYLAEIGLSPIFNQAFNGSMAIMAVFAVFGIAYSWVEDAGYQGVPAGFLALVVDLILQSDTLQAVNSEGQPVADAFVSGIINKQWLGGQGMIAAIVIGLLVGWGYTWFLKHEITIKLPEQVPANVAASFTALIPAAVIISIATAVYAFFHLALDTTFLEFLYKIIQEPLQAATDGPGGVLVITVIPVFLWFFGIHGTTIVSGIMSPLLQSNSFKNIELYREGKLSLENGATIVNQAFMDQFITVTGTGLTIGLVVYMLFFSKSAQMKTLGKLEVVPGAFNINEPILFGLPLVLNPLLAIPFFITPLLSGFGTYFLIRFGILPPLTGVQVPWTTPPVISGFLVGGWQHMLWQVVMLAGTFFVWFPFARKYDSILLAQENGTAE
jgi:PTS system cellobiose-specific IIC component